MRFGLGAGLGLAVASLVLCAQSTVHAEGSAEFDIGDVSGTHDPHDQAVSTPTEMFVDIADGTTEKICWRGTGSIRVYRPAPNGTTQVGGNIANNSCVDAVNGVNGAYGIALNASQDLGTEWDLRVCAKSVTNGNCFGQSNVNERLGRLWSYQWDFQENGGNYGNDTSNNGSVYAIVPGGDAGHDAVIEMQMRGVSGAWYSLFANSIGPETTAGVRVGRSVTRTGHQVTPAFPLYLNPPNVALYNWVTPTISNVTLAPSCGSGIVLGSSPGSISFNTNVTAQYVVVCDVDNDGAYNFGSTTDFSSFGNTVVGTNTVVWNGTTNAGSPAAPGTYNCIVRVNVGEFHYVAEDIESAFPGIRLYRVSSDRTTRTAINMYWDDTGVAADAENMPAPISALSPNTSPANGLNPGVYGTAASAFRYVASVATGNARGWGNFDVDGKGNNNFLDQFSAADTAQSAPFMVTVFASGVDQDGDGLTNVRECAIGIDPLDVDTDNDGVNDGYEATNGTAPDSDTDGTIDALDTDDDGDGIPTNTELGTNENGDGNPADAANSDTTGPADYLDVDSDNDGVCDGSTSVNGVCSGGPDTDPTDPQSCRDTDNDNCDDCANTGSNGSGGNPNNDGTDTDTDGACNLTDPDDDDDGVCDTGVAVANVCTAGPDTNPTDPNACSDSDGDTCDDCVSGNGATPNNDGTDTDGDGACNAGDPDDDNDGVADGGDSNPTNPNRCRDLDTDTCNDCALTGANNSGGAPANDGPDSDNDGRCNAGDPDDDNDGVCDSSTAVVGVCVAGPDTAPTNPNVCLDSDSDTCNDCTSGSYAPGNDGTDTDSDGSCDAGDPDDDDDGVCDTGTAVVGVCVAGPDTNPTDDNVCLDSDADTCNDCVNGSYAPGNDGTDTDSDGSCDAGDPDDDDDGVCDTGTAVVGVCVAGPDTNPTDDNVCADSDSDGCDDCINGSYDPSNDGVDLDNNGLCDSADPDDDDDGVCDDGTAVNGVCVAGPDTDPTDPNVCVDSDSDGCDDCINGNFDPSDDGADENSNGLCDVNEPTETDTDGDGASDTADLDDDNDGILDADEDKTGPGNDADNDGVPNRLDLDSDNDGIADIFEAGGFASDADGDGMVDGPFGENGFADDLETTVDSGSSTLGAIDTDGDGNEDFLDRDSDGDGRFDIAEVDALAGFDSDDDGAVDSTTDADADGLMDSVDSRDNERGWPKPASDPRADDADEDGIPQAYDADDAGPESGDSDDDTLTDEAECPNGWPCPDSDGDGQPNYTTPDDTTPPPDDDDDGVPNDSDLDSDNDGILDTQEDRAEADTDGIANASDLDSDGDGVFDAVESGFPGAQDANGDGHVDGSVGDNGVPDSVELGSPDSGNVGEPRDTDSDGTPDFLDPDDDGDGIPTVDERPDGMDVDTDDDGIPDYMDPDDDDDGIPTMNEDDDGDGNGVPDYLEPPREGTLAGGALCTVATPGTSSHHGLGFGAWLFAFALLGYFARRSSYVRLRGRGGSPKKVGSAAAVAALLVASLTTDAHAQVALDQFKPALLPSDGFALTRPDSLPKMKGALMLMLDYANDPLVYELRDPDEEREVVNDQFVLHVGGSIGVTDRVTVFATVPVHLVMDGEDPGALAPAADGPGLGDLALGGRFWLVGEHDSLFALSGELIARLPTASLINTDQVYSGDRVGSYEPALVAELRFGGFDIRVRPGVRVRQQRMIGNLKLGSELVYGVGARLHLAENLFAHLELFGSAMFANFGKREQTPLEALVGVKYGVNGWYFGTAMGPGLTQGYGSPDLRWLLTVAYSPEDEAAPAKAHRKPAEEAGPQDSDGDGVVDPYDACPRQPEDKDEFEDIDGCPDPDNDQDSVLDVSDHCPMDPEDDDNFEDQNGCPDPDNDQDGISDENDACPNEPEDVDQFEDVNGCPDPDNDQDTVLDVNDDCPLSPGAPDARGCPQSVRVDIENGQILILDRVEFATNKDVILDKSMSILHEVQATLAANAQLTLIRVEGHTDDVGRDTKNMDLSKRRARSVVRWLIEQGIARDRLEAFGCGENRPVHEGTDTETRQQNRRVEFHIVQPSTSQPRGTDGCQRIAN